MQKGRPKPKNQEKVITTKSYERLASRKTKDARTLAISLRVFGGVLMIGAASLWYSKYSVVPLTSLALIGGIILAGIFKLAYLNGLDAGNRIQRFVFLLFAAVVMVLFINQTTAAYAIMLLSGLVSAIYLFGAVKTLPGLKPYARFGYEGG